tara:strand:- start:275 stop:526 length:252 start_codon:yes stop_codon:yes gene_type:complete
MRETPESAPQKETPVLNPDDKYSIKCKVKPAPYKGKTYQDIPRRTDLTGLNQNDAFLKLYELHQAGYEGAVMISEQTGKTIYN